MRKSTQNLHLRRSEGSLQFIFPENGLSDRRKRHYKFTWKFEFRANSNKCLSESLLRCFLNDLRQRKEAMKIRDMSRNPVKLNYFKISKVANSGTCTISRHLSLSYVTITSTSSSVLLSSSLVPEFNHGSMNEPEDDNCGELGQP